MKKKIVLLPYTENKARVTAQKYCEKNKKRNYKLLYSILNEVVHK
jgi:hypothetical protein